MKSNLRLSVEISGIGSHLPEKVLTNHDLERMVNTSDEWIVPRTGIKERRIAAESEAVSDLAALAARKALEQAGLGPKELDAILVATCTPDHFFPATACLVQTAIGAENAVCHDIEAACSGFVFALSEAAAMIGGGFMRNVLIVGSEVLSKFTDYTDRHSCILFGDGAGAAVLTRSEGESEIIYCEMGSDGSRPEILVVPAGGSRRPASRETVERREHYMQLQGREVFKWAVGKLGELMLRIPEETGIGLDQINLIVPHQSNVRIIRSACERAGVPVEKAFMNIERVGNTSSASIPIALDEAIQQGRLQRGDLVLLLAFGGGITWGSVLLRY